MTVVPIQCIPRARDRNAAKCASEIPTPKPVFFWDFHGKIHRLHGLASSEIGGDFRGLKWFGARSPADFRSGTLVGRRPFVGPARPSPALIRARSRLQPVPLRVAGDALGLSRNAVQQGSIGGRQCAAEILAQEPQPLAARCVAGRVVELREVLHDPSR